MKGDEGMNVKNRRCFSGAICAELRGASFGVSGARDATHVEF